MVSRVRVVLWLVLTWQVLTGSLGSFFVTDYVAVTLSSVFPSLGAPKGLFNPCCSPHPEIPPRRYPLPSLAGPSLPLCRLHITHLALGSLAKNESRLGYEKLRETYNTVRPASAPEAPPLDEWKGIGCICHHVFCR